MKGAGGVSSCHFLMSHNNNIVLKRRSIFSSVLTSLTPRLKSSRPWVAPQYQTPLSSWFGRWSNGPLFSFHYMRQVLNRVDVQISMACGCRCIADAWPQYCSKSDTLIGDGVLLYFHSQINLNFLALSGIGTISMNFKTRCLCPPHCLAIQTFEPLQLAIAMNSAFAMESWS